MASNVINPNNSEGDDALDTVELAREEEEERSVPPSTPNRPSRSKQSKREEAQFSLLTSELPETEETEEESDGGGAASARTPLENQGRNLPLKTTFWYRMSMGSVNPDNEHDPYFDFSEDDLKGFRCGKEVNIPSLKECHGYLLECDEVEKIESYRRKSARFWRLLWDKFLSIVAALYIYVRCMLGIEPALVVLNSALATYFYCRKASDYAVKLDFSFLSFAIVFPLTFLLQTNFGHRDKAVVRTSNFSSAVLNSALFTLTVDWPAKNGDSAGGRYSLPKNFNSVVVKDYHQLVQLVYEYLSLPSVGYSQYIAFSIKDNVSKRVHSLQNDIVKRLRRTLYNFSMHMEEMRKHGFSGPEASRMNQYHSSLEEGFEHLRAIKYYRSPQATRAYGVAYMWLLPWISGPYFAWVFQSTNLAYTITLACFTVLIVYGLINPQHDLEDPFVSDDRGWAPGIDNVKLDYEMSSILQGIQQYYADAELRRSWELAKDSKKEAIKGPEQTV